MVFPSSLAYCNAVDLRFTKSNVFQMNRQSRGDMLSLDGAKKIFIQRDFSSGMTVKFQKNFPEELRGKIDPQLFYETIEEINKCFEEAERLGARNTVESCLACMTAYLVYLCVDTHYEKRVKKVRQYIHDQNDKIYSKQGVIILDPMERGLRCIEVIIVPEEFPPY